MHVMPRSRPHSAESSHPPALPCSFAWGPAAAAMQQLHTIAGDDEQQAASKQAGVLMLHCQPASELPGVQMSRLAQLPTASCFLFLLTVQQSGCDVQAACLRCPALAQGRQLRPLPALRCTAPTVLPQPSFLLLDSNLRIAQADRHLVICCWHGRWETSSPAEAHEANPRQLSPVCCS